MTKKVINTGNIANDGSGDTLRDAMGKINENFDELYSTQGTFIADAPIDSSGYVRLNGTWTSLDSTGTITDVNNDGILYARRDQAWVSIPSNLEAPIDGNPYGRVSQAWTRVVEEANSDGTSYVRLNGEWAAIPDFIGEAPENGTPYVRQDAGWTNLSAITGVPEAQSNGQVYARSDSDWVDITAQLEAGGIVDAPVNGNYYLRINSNWGALDSAALTSAVGSVWENPAGVDSSAVTTLIDSDYINARTDANIDSAAVVAIIDSDYVNARVSGVDSAAVELIIDSDYVNARVSGVDSAAVTLIVDSDYITSRVNVDQLNDVTVQGSLTTGDVLLYDDVSGPQWYNVSLQSAATTIIDSDYVAARTPAGGSGGLDSAAVIGLIDSAYIEFIVDSDYVALRAPTGGSLTLAELTTVTLTSPSDAQVLAFDSATSQWVNANPAASGEFSRTVNQIYSSLAGSGGTNGFSAGTNAGDNNTGGNNIFIGFGSGQANTSASNNVFIGSLTGQYSTSANNVFLGDKAGSYISGGANSGNTFVGEYAGGYSDNGVDNTFLGRRAGNTAGGSSNIFLGALAGNESNASGTNLVVIGSNAQPSGSAISNEITLGNTSITRFRIPGLQSGATNGDVLTYDSASGTMTLATPSGGAGWTGDSSQVSAIITADVNKAFVDALNVDADTLDTQNGTFYLDYTNFTNTPNILDSAAVTLIVDSDYVAARTPASSGGLDSASTIDLIGKHGIEPKQISLILPSDSDEFTIARYNKETTITEINGVIRGGTSAVFSIRYDSDRSAIGTEVDSAGSTISSTTTGTTISAFDNPVIPPGSWIWLEMGTVTGVVEELTISIELEQ